MDARAFYDALADDYHLIYADWPASVRRQAAALDRVIREELGDGLAEADGISISKHLDPFGLPFASA